MSRTKKNVHTQNSQSYKIEIFKNFYFYLWATKSSFLKVAGWRIMNYLR